MLLHLQKRMLLSGSELREFAYCIRLPSAQFQNGYHCRIDGSRTHLGNDEVPPTFLRRVVC